MLIICKTCGRENRNTFRFCGGCGGMLQSSSPSGPLSTGILLENRYNILTLIKAGGMGAVYKATDNKLDRICAIKELLPPYGTSAQQAQASEWFKREAQLLAKLSNANLPAVIDYFTCNSRYYLVMEFIEGVDLETLLRKEGKPGLPADKVIECAKQVLQVLDYLHTQNPPIVYRDIKPGNIMLHKDGRAMLIDFGIARVVNEASQTKKTAVGTQGYAPPEQCRGQAESRSDIYALGATMHHLLTGIQPIPFMFEPVSKSVKVSVNVESIVMKALSLNIQDRFKSAREMMNSFNNNQSVTISSHKQYTPANVKSNVSLVNIPPTAPLSTSMQNISLVNIPPTAPLSTPIQSEKHNMILTYGWALHKAAEKGELQIVKILISKGADVNVKDKDGETPLHMASSNGHKKITELLISNGADVNVKDKNGYTPLHWASIDGNNELAELLISNGANVNAKDKNGGTPLDWASSNGHKEITELLISKRADSKNIKEKPDTPINSGMLLINGGTFQMRSNNGGNNERPVHNVTVNNFYMGKYPVTNKEYKLFRPNHKSKWSDPDYPVERVSWYDTIAYCNWLSDREGFERCYSGSGDNITFDITKKGYRLPMEAEWEYACRAGSTTAYYWGNRMDGDYCWYSDNSNRQVHPVGQKKPNAWGLYDMLGNVWEWCSDWYDSSSQYRVLRGGGWYVNASDCRSGFRSKAALDIHDGGLGFRIVMEP